MLYAEGKKDDALKAMSDAADAEDRTEKHPVTPGVPKPARELYGEMLLDSGNAKEALTAFEATLKKEPNRLGALPAQRRRRRNSATPPRRGNISARSSNKRAIKVTPAPRSPMHELISKGIRRYAEVHGAMSVSALALNVLVTSANADSLQIVGDSGYLGEWELTAAVTEESSPQKRIFGALLDETCRPVHPRGTGGKERQDKYSDELPLRALRLRYGSTASNAATREY